MKLFPAFVYHAVEGAKKVHSAEEFAALGPGWEDSPAKCVPPAPDPAPVSDPAPPADPVPSDPVPAGPVPAEDPSPAPSGDDPAEAAAQYKASALSIAKALATASEDTLRKAERYEVANPKGPRKAVVDAIAARRHALTP